VADEPTNGELARQLADIKLMLAAVVGHPEYAADKRYLDSRFADLADDLAEERRQRADAIEQERRDRAAAIKATNERIDAGRDTRMHWRTLLWTGALPALVALLGVIVTIALSHGGHG
jgi:hypothetical protein